MIRNFRTGMPGLRKIKQRMWAWMLFRILLMLELKELGTTLLCSTKKSLLISKVLLLST
jgi:hypothetical protein